eukprot:5885508-Alexandrium_andersonii.AAC.1
MVRPPLQRWESHDLQDEGQDQEGGQGRQREQERERWRAAVRRVGPGRPECIGAARARTAAG